MKVVAQTWDLDHEYRLRYGYGVFTVLMLGALAVAVFLNWPEWVRWPLLVLFLMLDGAYHRAVGRTRVLAQILGETPR